MWIFLKFKSWGSHQRLLLKMYVGAYETSRLKSFLFGFFFRYTFFPYVDSCSAFFCYQRSLHVISYHATMAKEQEYLLSSRRKPNSSCGLYSLNKDVAKTENFKSKWCSNGNDLVGLSQSIVLSDKAFRTFIPICTVFASLVMPHSPCSRFENVKVRQAIQWSRWSTDTPFPLSRRPIGTPQWQ